MTISGRPLASFAENQRCTLMPDQFYHFVLHRRCPLFGGSLLLQSTPIQQIMSGRILPMVTFSKHAECVTDIRSIIKRVTQPVRGNVWKNCFPLITIIIQQIVTMPIYGKEALDICHPTWQISCDIRKWPYLEVYCRFSFIACLAAILKGEAVLAVFSVNFNSLEETFHD